MPPDSESPDPNERFRRRRADARKRRKHHRSVALAGGLVAAALVALGATWIGTHGHDAAGGKASMRSKQTSRPPGLRPLPTEVRGVHVTMSLASIPGKLGEYLRIPGLNTLEVDVKDEKGQVGFRMPGWTLAHKVGAALPFYNARRVAAQVHAKGVYLIGRLVVFEDPILTPKRPDLAIRRSDGSVWTNNAGLGWANPYDKRVWSYNLSIARAAVRAGFDEIQLDYVRFPSDGPIQLAVFPRKENEPQGWTIARFIEYMSSHLRPMGVRVSADVFGLSATHDLGIGQFPRRLSKYLDTIYPMVYPSHYRPGEFNLPDPSAVPGETVALSLQDFRNALIGERTMLIPWLEDFTLAGGHRPAEEVRAQIRSARRYHTRGFLLWNPEGVYTTEVLK